MFATRLTSELQLSLELLSCILSAPALQSDSLQLQAREASGCQCFQSSFCHDAMFHIQLIQVSHGLAKFCGMLSTCDLLLEPLAADDTVGSLMLMMSLQS